VTNLPGGRGVTGLPVRRLTAADLPACSVLAVDRDWEPTPDRWRLLYELGEIYGVDDPDGRGLAGAVALTRWAADYAAVGMMLVAARYGRRGLGRALMDHALRAAGRGATVTLFATDMGRPLYEKLGFAAVRRNVPFVGRFRALPGDGAGGVRSATLADLPAILDLDRAAFGADRGHILTRLYTLVDRMVVAEAGGPGGRGLAGYAAAWRNTPASAVIGPLVAPDGETARHLVTALAADAATPVRLDLDPDRPELPGWAHAHGLEPAGLTVVMAHGRATARGTPGRLFTPISVALA
jgi:GNAT superfamily N-acetyltransferase